MTKGFNKDIQFYKFCLYGFFKNLRFFEPFLLLFFLEKGITFLQIGTLIAIREIFVNIFEIPSGVIADSFGRKKSLIISFLFYIGSFLIFYTSINYSFFIAAMILYAIGDAFRTGTHKAMIFDYLKANKWHDQRASYYGHTRSWSQIGSAISSLIAAGIVFYSGSYQYIFIYSTIPYILDLFLILSYPEFLDGKHKKFSASNIIDKFNQVIKDFLYSFKNKTIIRAVGNLSFHSGLHKSIKDYLQPVIQTFALAIPVGLALSDKQKSALLIGILYFIIYLFTSFASRSAGKFKSLNKTEEKALNITMYVGFIFTFLTGFFYHNSFFIISIVFYIGIYLVENLRNPIGVSYVSHLYKDEILATALSANSQAKSLIAAVFAPVIGLLSDKFGVGVALLTIAVLLIILSPLLIAKTKDQNNTKLNN